MSTTTKPSLQSILDDLSARFFLNLPEEELTFERLFFQMEQAHWFYEDQYMANEKSDKVPDLKFKVFCRYFFRNNPVLHQHEKRFDELFNQFCEYLGQIPVCGCIILNPTADKCIMVRQSIGKTYGFPKGKINHNEREIECAARESLEETGFDPSSLIKESDFIQGYIQGKKMRLYIIQNVSESQPFEPHSRKEIGDIKWVPLEALPNWTPGTTKHEKRDRKASAGTSGNPGSEHDMKSGVGSPAATLDPLQVKCTYYVQHFTDRLLSWIRRNAGANNKQRKQGKTSSKPKTPDKYPKRSPPVPQRLLSSGSHAGGRPNSNSNTASPLESGLSGRWSPEDMFATNEALFGVKSTAPVEKVNAQLASMNLNELIRLNHTVRQNSLSVTSETSFPEIVKQCSSPPPSSSKARKQISPPRQQSVGGKNSAISASLSMSPRSAEGHKSNSSAKPSNKSKQHSHHQHAKTLDYSTSASLSASSAFNYKNAQPSTTTASTSSSAFTKGSAFVSSSLVNFKFDMSSIMNSLETPLPIAAASS